LHFRLTNTFTVGYVIIYFIDRATTLHRRRSLTSVGL